MPRWVEVRLLRLALAGLCLVLASACSSILRNPVPEQYHLDTTVLGRDDLRIWGDREGFQIYTLEDLEQEEAQALQERYSGIMNREHHYLAISGGGANGAYGAGVLAGWTKPVTGLNLPWSPGSVLVH